MHFRRFKNMPTEPTFSFQLLSELSETLPAWLETKKPSSIWVVCDRNTRRHCLPLLRKVLPQAINVMEIPVGEPGKNLQTCEKIWKKWTDAKVDRQALVLMLGGGVVCDLGAFAASVFKRGLSFCLIPTSLLAMTDASLGGKTGVDFLDFKNQIGTFSHPEEVWIYPGFLKTLPEGELRNGFAEVMKHLLISDAPFWNKARKRDLEQQDFTEVIGQSLLVKQQIVNEDPKENGIRKKLNAGHTLGHALETLFLKKGQAISHGAAVAAGLVMESRIAVEKGLLSDTELVQIEEFIFPVFGPIQLTKKEIAALIGLCMQDKKNHNGEIRLSLLGPVGSCHTDVVVSENELRLGIRYYMEGA